MKLHLKLFAFTLMIIAYACSQKVTKVASAPTPPSTPPPPVVTAPAPPKPAVPSVESSSVGLDLASKVPVDPAVRIGKLSNGMTYYIRKNARPEKRVELRLAVNTGSIMEDNDQLGVAHFVEHMAFNGSTHFKKQELVNYLESVGTQFGADLNAHTSFDETVYQLQVRSDQPDKLDKGLLVMEDWANGVSFDPVEIDKERGVVISEWRNSLSPNQRIFQKMIPVLLSNSHYAERLPIGKPEVLEKVSYEAVKRFYKDWYRPELMAIMAVGDVDLDKMEADLKSRFGKIPASPTNVRKRETYEVPMHDDTKILIATDKELPNSSVQVINKFTKKMPTTIGDFRNNLMVNIYNAMIGARLEELTQKPNPPYNFASSSFGDFLANLNAYSSIISVNDGNALKGMEAVLVENERAAKYGFNKSELDRQKEELIRQYESAVKEKDKTESGNIIESYVSNFMEHEFIMSPEQEFDLAKKLISTIDLTEINLLPKKWVSDKSRVILVTGPEKTGVTYPTENDIHQLLNNVKSMNITPYEDKVSNDALISKDLMAVDILSEKSNELIGTKEFTLKNGVKVVLKKTDFKNDEIIMNSFSPGGGSQYGDNDEIDTSFATSFISNAGIGKLDQTQLQKRLTGKIVGVNPYIDNNYEGLNGNASPADLELLFQLVYLYFTEPRKDTAAFRSFIDKQKGFIKNVTANPQFYFLIEANKIKTQGSPRSKLIPTEEDLAALNFDRAYQIYRDRFANAGDFTFTFVGNFDENQIKMLSREYLGNLPSTGRKEMWKDLNIRKPSGVVTKSWNRGEAPKTYVDITYHGTFDWNDINRYQLSTMIDLLRIKLRESLREDKGGVYGVSVNGGAQKEPVPNYTMTISFNCDPLRTEELIKATQDVLDNQKKIGADTADITKVTETQRQGKIKNLKENRYWMGQLQQIYQLGIDPSNLPMESLEKKIATITPTSMKSVLNKYVNEGSKITITQFPEKKSN